MFMTSKIKESITQLLFEKNAITKDTIPENNNDHEYIKDIDNLEDIFERYLHGECDVFAVAYKEIFGGEIMAILDFDGCLIHAWVHINKVNVDINGFFHDADDYLMNNYGDWWDAESGNEPEPISSSEVLRLGGHGRDDIDLAKSFITRFIQFYRP